MSLGINQISNSIDPNIFPSAPSQQPTDEAISVLWKKVESKATREIEITPRVAGKNASYAKRSAAQVLADGTVVLKEKTKFQLKGTKNFPLSEMSLYVLNENQDQFQIPIVQYKKTINVEFKTPDMSEVKKWGKKYAFCLLTNSQEIWKCDKLQVVEQPKVTAFVNGSTNTSTTTDSSPFLPNTEWLYFVHQMAQLTPKTEPVLETQPNETEQKRKIILGEDRESKKSMTAPPKGS